MKPSKKNIELEKALAEVKRLTSENIELKDKLNTNKIMKRSKYDFADMQERELAERDYISEVNVQDAIIHIKQRLISHFDDLRNEAVERHLKALKGFDWFDKSISEQYFGYRAALTQVLYDIRKIFEKLDEDSKKI